jgi:hypothetical protein
MTLTLRWARQLDIGTFESFNAGQWTMDNGPTDISSRIRVTTSLPNHSMEGTLFAADPITNLIAVNTAAPVSASSAISKPGNYHVIPVSQIQNFQIVSAAGDGEEERTNGFDAALPSISRLDLDALRAREEAAIRKMKEFDATRGKGVTKEAQEIFDWFART